MSGSLYILLCADRSYYVGSTSNLKVRDSTHEMGEGGDYTSRRPPVRLVFSQEFASMHDAFLAERQVKGRSRAKKIAFVRRDYHAMVDLARNHQVVSQESSP